jgi:multisubunit Na+/H+ antiporter MnhE subunit
VANGRAVGALAEVAAWTAVLLLVYLATLSTFSGGELVIAACAAVPAAVLAWAGRRVTAAHWSLDARWFRWLLLLPGAVAADLARLPRWAARRGSGSFRTLTLPVETEARTRGRMAVGGLAMSLTPGSYVVESRASGRTMMVHQLASDPGRLERAVTE